VKNEFLIPGDWKARIGNMENKLVALRTDLIRRIRAVTKAMRATTAQTERSTVTEQNSTIL
jgi:hypothetical protein